MTPYTVRVALSSGPATNAELTYAKASTFSLGTVVASSSAEHPVFPLSTVVFPGGVLPMRIFEPRYLDMVSHCMRQASPFVLIRHASERHAWLKKLKRELVEEIM